MVIERRIEMSDYEQKATEAIKGCYWKKKIGGVPICGGTCVPCSETIRAGQCETLIELFNKEQKGGETDDR